MICKIGFHHSILLGMDETENHYNRLLGLDTPWEATSVNLYASHKVQSNYPGFYSIKDHVGGIL